MPCRPNVDISLVVSSRNRAHGLKNCLDAIALAAEKAGSLTLELVFVDNGSTDETASLFREWASTVKIVTQLISEPSLGLAVARNSGMMASNGRIVAFTDDDCALSPDYFTSLAASFADDKEPVIRGGRIELGDARDLPVTIKTELQPAVLTNDLHTGGFIHGANMAFPRTVIETIGLFDTRFGAGSPFRSGEDTDYVHRGFNAGITVEYSPHFVVKHFHGRRTVEQIRRLYSGYAFGNGALYAKYFFDRRSNMRGMLRWDIRQALREILNWRERGETAGFSHRGQLIGNIRGMIAYWRSAARTGSAGIPATG